MLQTLGLSFRLLQREWRAGELRALAVALIVAVGAMTSVGFFTDRTGRALERQSGELLGADLRIAASSPLPDALRADARRLELRQAETVSFPSMVLAGDAMRLAEIKAVSSGYPLRGRLQAAAAVDAPGSVTALIPERGTIWAEPALFDALGIRPGDALTVGEVQLRATRVLTFEPDRGGELFSIAPRVLMNLDDLAATQLVQPGSRIRYHLLTAGAAEAVAAYRALVEERLQPGMKIEGVDDARPELRAALDRARRFLGLAALASVLLAGVAVGMAARRFSARQLDSSAMLRCLGASQLRITGLFGSQLLLLGLIASLLGGLLGFGGQLGLARLLSGLVPDALPSPSPVPLLVGLLTGLLVLLGFAMPPLLRLKNTPTLRVLRRELGPPPGPALVTYGSGLAVFAALLLWQAGDLKLGGYMLAGSAGATLLLVGLALALIRALRTLRGRVGVMWAFGLANLSRRAAGSAAQVAALGLGIMILLLLSVVRVDLLHAWEDKLPQDAPNRFLINVQPDQIGSLNAFFQHQGMPPPQLYPMVRARLTAIDGRAVSPQDFEDDRARRLVDREFNLSWTNQVAADNRVISGAWWTPAQIGSPLFSVEGGIAETLGIRLGDRLTYRIAGQELTGMVTNLREVSWDSFRVNFFVVTPTGVLEQYPQTYITSFYLPKERRQLLNGLVQEFPNITVIDVDAVMTQVRAIMGRVTRALEYVFLFTLGAGIVVLYAAIQATHDERLQESTLLRTLGARRRQLVAGWTTEFAVLGLLAGAIAALAASLLAYVLAAQVFDLPYQPNPWLFLWGPLAGTVGAAVAGFLGMRALLRRPPLETLRAL